MREAYARDGFARVPGLLDGGEVTALRDAFEATLAVDVARARYPSAAACLRIVQRWPRMDLRQPAFAALLDPRTPAGARVCAVFAELLPGRDARLISLDVLVKAAGSGLRLPWHQDSPTWQAAPEALAARLWIALDRVDEDTGGVRYAPGSHIDGLTDGDGVTPHLQPGDALLHHPDVWHSSGPNRTSGLRRAVLVTLAAPDARTRDGRPWDDAEHPVLVDRLGTV